MVPSLDENQLELATVDYFRELGYDYIQGPAIAPDGLPAARLPDVQGQAGETPEREDYAQVVRTRRLRDAMVRINPDVPDEAVEGALRQVTRTDLSAARLPDGQGQAEPAAGRGGVRSCACVPLPGNLLYSPH